MCWSLYASIAKLGPYQKCYLRIFFSTSTYWKTQLNTMLALFLSYYLLDCDGKKVSGRACSPSKKTWTLVPEAMWKSDAMEQLAIISALLFGKWKLESGFPEAGSSANIVSIASSNKRLFQTRRKIRNDTHPKWCSDLHHIEPIHTPRNTHAWKTTNKHLQIM